MKDYEFCKHLKALREKAGMTQNELEKASDLPTCVVSFYENGTRQPGLNNIKALCRGLKCSASELLGV